MFLHIIAVNYVTHYTLLVIFNNGVRKQVNLQHELDGEIFEPLKNIERFKQVRVNPETKTIEWPNGADLAPEFLYEIGQIDQEREEKMSSDPTMQPVLA